MNIRTYDINVIHILSGCGTSISLQEKLNLFFLFLFSHFMLLGCQVRWRQFYYSTRTSTTPNLKINQKARQEQRHKTKARGTHA